MAAPFVNAEIILTVAEAILPDPNPYTPSLSGAHNGTISRITVLTGHLTTHVQTACVAVVQEKFDELTDFLKHQGLLREVQNGLYSHIYCPFIWRVLTLGGRAVPPSWLIYGPRSAGLFRNIVTTPRNPGENPIIFANRYGTDLSDPTVYQDPAWGQACLEASQIPGVVDRIYQLVTDPAEAAAAAHWHALAAGRRAPLRRLAAAVPDNNNNLGGGARYRYKTRRIKRRKLRLLSRRR